jgi:DNA polymerase-3 subunit delta
MMFYLLYGADEFSRQEALAQMKRKLGDPTTASLNTTILDGRSLTLAALQAACDTVPFLADKRLVIVEGLAARWERRQPGEGVEPKPLAKSDRELEEALQGYLGQLPASTRLVFVDDEVSASNPLLRLAKAHSGYVKEFPPRRGRELHAWIAERVKQKGGRITNEAVAALAVFVGENLRLLDQEIEKLLTYAGPGRDLQKADVEALVPYAREARIFDLVDAIGQRQRETALRLLHQMLDDGTAPAYLMVMFARQFRLLLQGRELLDGGAGKEAIVAALKLHPFVADKVLLQARNFTLEHLERIYRRLLDADVAMKTGRAEETVALDLLVVELTGG